MKRMTAMLLMISMLLSVIPIGLNHFIEEKAVPAHIEITPVWHNLTPTYVSRIYHSTYPYVWNNVRNATNGSVIDPGNGIIWQSVDNVVPEITRLFFNYNLTSLPRWGTILDAFVNITTSAAGVNNTKVHIISDVYAQSSHNPIAPFHITLGIGQQYPHTTLRLSDFNINNYMAYPLVRPQYDKGVGYSWLVHEVDFHFNSYGRNAIAMMNNLSEDNARFGFGMITEQDFNATNHYGLTIKNELQPISPSIHSDLMKINLSLLMSGGSSRRNPTIIPAPIFDPTIVQSWLASLLFFFGLIGMMVIPAVIVTKMRSGEEFEEKYTGSIVLIGFFVICFGFFWWALFGFG